MAKYRCNTCLPCVREASLFMIKSALATLSADSLPREAGSYPPEVQINFASTAPLAKAIDYRWYYPKEADPGRHWHLVDYHCGLAGGEDFGFLKSYQDARYAMADQIVVRGRKGGCRHKGGGWTVRGHSSDETTDHCRPYDGTGLNWDGPDED